MPKCDLNKVASQLYLNRTSAWAFSCKFAAYLRNTFPKNASGWPLLVIERLHALTWIWLKKKNHHENIMDRSNHWNCSIKLGVLKNFAKFKGKHLCQSLFFNKAADLRPATLLKKRLCQSCFPANFAKFLRTPFLQNTFDCFFVKKNSFHQICPAKYLEISGYLD